jgi:Domain of unknown function (DUF4760)
MPNWQLVFQAVTATGTGIGAAVIVVAYKQFQDTRRWNRVKSAFDHLPKAIDLSPIESRLNASFLKLIDRSDPLSTAEVQRLFEDAEATTRLELKNYLNMLETYCVAINMGIVDDKVARRIYGNKFVRHFREMKPYLDAARSRQGPKIWTELEEVAKRWEEEEAKSERLRSHRY